MEKAWEYSAVSQTPNIRFHKKQGFSKLLPFAGRGGGFFQNKLHPCPWQGERNKKGFAPPTVLRWCIPSHLKERGIKGELVLAPPTFYYLSTSPAVKNKGFTRLSAVLDDLIDYEILTMHLFLWQISSHSD